MSTSNSDTLKAIICFVVGLVVMSGCALVYWVCAHDTVASHNIEPIGTTCGIIAFIFGGGMLAIGAKLITGFEFE